MQPCSIAPLAFAFATASRHLLSKAPRTGEHGTAGSVQRVLLSQLQLAVQCVLQAVQELLSQPVVLLLAVLEEPLQQVQQVLLSQLELLSQPLLPVLLAVLGEQQQRVLLSLQQVLRVLLSQPVLAVLLAVLEVQQVLPSLQGVHRVLL